MARMFGSTWVAPARSNRASGGLLNCTATSVTRVGSALPVRR